MIPAGIVAAVPGIPGLGSCAPTLNPLSIGSCLSGIGKAAAGDAFAQIAQAFGKAADTMVGWLWAQLSSATAIHLGGQAFDQLAAVAGAIAGVFAVGIFLWQMAASAIKRDPGGIRRSVGGLFVMGLGAGACVAVTGILLETVDALSAGVLQVTTGESVDQVGSAILAVGAFTQLTGNPALLLILSILAVIAVFMVWLALTVRKMLVIVAAVLAPFAFAGSLADFSRSWARRWVELVAALIFSKLILIFIFVIGLDVMVRGVGQAGTGVGQEITQALSGVLILCLAGLAPLSAVRLAHFAGAHLEAGLSQHAVASQGHRTVTSMARPVGAAATAGTPLGPAFGAWGVARPGSQGPPPKSSRWSPPGAPPAPAATNGAPAASGGAAGPTNGQGPAQSPTPPAGPGPAAHTNGATNGGPVLVETGPSRVDTTPRQADLADTGLIETGPPRLDTTPRQANVRDGSPLMHAIDQAYHQQTSRPSPKGDTE